MFLRTCNVCDWSEGAGSRSARVECDNLPGGSCGSQQSALPRWHLVAQPCVARNRP